jgi:hypothetical protein
LLIAKFQSRLIGISNFSPMDGASDDLFEASQSARSATITLGRVRNRRQCRGPPGNLATSNGRTLKDSHCFPVPSIASTGWPARMFSPTSATITLTVGGRA